MSSKDVRYIAKTLLLALPLALIAHAGPLTSTAYAQGDPFDSFDDDSNAGEQKPGSATATGSQNFLGTISPGSSTMGLYNSGPVKEKPEGWREFEDVSGTDIEKKYNNSREMKVRRELEKPLPYRPPVSGGLDDLEEAIKSLNTKPSGGADSAS